MEKEDFYYLGTILKAYGNFGHVLVSVDAGDPGQYRSADFVFVEIRGEFIPFFLESLEPRAGQKAILKFLDINTVSETKPVLRCGLYLPLSSLPKPERKKFYSLEVIGFTVVDDRLGAVGTVDSIIELPAQPVFRILHGRKEILVPAVDAIVRKVDRKARKIYITAPEGLIDLYLGPSGSAGGGK
jgi:16S rRNA processing protein RimM